MTCIRQHVVSKPLNYHSRANSRDAGLWEITPAVANAERLGTDGYFKTKGSLTAKISRLLNLFGSQVHSKY